MHNKVIRTVAAFGNNYHFYLKFIIQQIFWVALMFLLVPLFAWTSTKVLHYNLDLSDFVLIITAAFILSYTFETKKIREQTKEMQLRPIILRSGWISSWQDIKFQSNGQKNISGKPIEFDIMENIATDLNGYIVIDGKKYKLMFGNHISKATLVETFYLKDNWGWLAPNTKIYALFNSEDFKVTNEANCIRIFYSDIEGSEYCTIEDISFSQKSFKF